MLIDEYLIRYFETEEAFESDADEWIDDLFYSEIAYDAKAYDLMFNNMYYRIEVYKKEDKLKPIKIFIISNFNRKQYYDRR